MKWQLIASSGITLGFIESIAAKTAVEKWRANRDQHEPYYDKFYNYEVEGNKILFKEVATANDNHTKRIRND